METSPAQRRTSRTEEPNAAPPSPSSVMSSRTSYDSDRATNTSTVSGLTNHFPSNTVHVSPPPAYVGHTGASQAVSDLYLLSNGSRSGPDNRDASRDVRFSDPALALINAFLDQLLYGFLSSARSASLPALRPAVDDVLKHRLAKGAMSNADAELAELLGGVEDEEETDEAQGPKVKWDLDLVWKRTRLRVMVYTRLGEMEDEDEQRFVEREQLFQDTERSFSNSGLVAWSAAIFLTSVLEYVAERCLQAAGQAACTRVQRESRDRPSTPSAEHREGDVIVEEYDVEKIALNPALGRLWRTWRKALRTQGVSVRPSPSSIGRASRENMTSRMSHHTDSAESDSKPRSRHRHMDSSEANDSESTLAANIPLPMLHSGRDIDEITAVGLARDPDDDDALDGQDRDTLYPTHVLAPLVPLPMGSEQRDLDEIIVPGLARDPEQAPLEIPTTDSYPALALALLVMLPMLDAEKDVDEIEVPGLAKDPDAVDGNTVDNATTRRRRSVAGTMNEWSTSAGSEADSLLMLAPVMAQRSSSVPPSTRVLQGSMEERLAESPIGSPRTLRDAALDEKTQTGEQAAGEQSAGTDEAHDSIVSASKLSGVDEKSSKADQSLLAGSAAALAGTAAVAAATLFSSSPRKDVEHDAESNAIVERKSLGDMKSLLADSGANSGRDVLQPPRAGELQSPGFMNIDSDDSSYNLVDGLHSAAASSKTSVNKAGSVQNAGNVTPERAITRHSRLHFDQDLNGREDEAARDIQLTPRTPRTFLDLTDERDDEEQMPHIHEEQPSPESALGGAMEQVYRPSKSLQQNKGVSFEAPEVSQGMSSLEGGGVQEHPVVQRMASLKGGDAHSSPGSETAAPVASAAIRGPEDFDLFVQGSETRKYTLTPEGVRDPPADNTIRYSGARSSPIELDGASLSPKVDRSSADSRTGALRTSILRGTTASPTSQVRTVEPDYRSLSRPFPRAASGSRNGLLAREPRVTTESTRDIADFLRSTGPSQSSATMLRASPRTKSSLQPRSPKAETDGSADLIDFIRSGPSESGQHRIPRTVAPFRTTMDSDQFDDLSARQSADTRSQSVLSSYAPSFRTSTNSRSALLNGNSNGNGTSVNQTAPLSPNGASVPRSTGVLADPNSSSPRKQYRNKDPYALDFDDDFTTDDDLLDVKNPSNSKQESMFDFLRNYEPAPSGPPQPLIDPNSAHARRLINEARAREREKNSTSPTVGKVATTTTSDPPRAPTPQFAGTYSPTRPKMEARSPVTQGAGVSSSTTNDLAAFIRASGPAESDAWATASPAMNGPKASAVYHNQETKRKKGGLFGLQKRKTYLDMP